MNKSNLSQTWAAVRAGALTSLVTLFGLQMMRMLFASLVGYLRDARGVSSINLAPLALGIFSLAFLAALPPRFLGWRRSLWLIAGGLALVRLVEQFYQEPQLDLLLSAIGVVLFLIYLPLAVGIARAHGEPGGPQIGFALVLGITLDSVIQVGFNTLDLSWQSGWLPVLILAILCILLMVAARQEAAELEITRPFDGNWRVNIPLLAIGPWLLLQLLVYQNIAGVSARIGIETPLSGLFVVISNSIALLFLAWVSKLKLGLFNKTLLAGLFLVLSLLFFEQSGITAAILSLTGMVFSTYLVMTVLSVAVNETGKTGLLRTSISCGTGQVLFVIFTFFYYLTYDIDLGFDSSTLLPVIAAVLAGGAIIASLGQEEPIFSGFGYYPAAAAFFLVVVPIFSFFTWREPVPLPPDPANVELRVMTYNLHNGFNRDGRLDLEALALIIEDSGAQVVGLQEVSRGWLIWGGVDMLAWLSQRLDMLYISGPTADAQWGNAVLSRLPIVSSGLYGLPTEELLLRRGYILTEIDFGAGTAFLITTHFHHISEDSEMRVQQSQAILSGLPSGDPTVLMGDLNATPDSPEMQVLSGAGLVDAAAVYGIQPTFTYLSDQPYQQIDYLWLTPDLSGLDFKILQTTASDHLPIVMTVQLNQ